MKVKAPAPDPLVGQAALGQTRIAERALNMQEANDRYYRENFAPRYLEQMDKQIAAGDRLLNYQLGLSDKYDRRYWDTTAKQQDAFYGLVDAYDTEDERARLAGMAGADVERAYGAAEGQLARGLARQGVNPNSGMSIVLQQRAGLDKALAKSSAMTMAQEAARREGLNLRAQAAGLGGNLTGASAGYASGALGAAQLGMSGIQGAQQGSNSNAASSAGMFGTASGAYGNVGQLGMGLTNMRYDANKSNAMGINQLLGAGMGMFRFSDRRLKTNVRRIGSRLDGLGLYEFEYVWGGGRHTGVMSDEVRQVYPDAVSVSDGYDVVNYAALG